MPVRVPKYRLHKPSGQALVEIRGQRIYLGKFDSSESRERYHRIICELLKPGVETQVISANPLQQITVSELILGYFQYARQYYTKGGKPTDEIAAIRTALRRLRKLYGNIPANDFGPKSYKLVREAMIQEGLSRKYINDSMARILRMFFWGVAEELLPPAIPQALKSVPGLRKGRSAAQESKPIQALPEETYRATLPFLPPVVRQMVGFQRLTGCRPAEVCNLRSCDVDQSEDIWIYSPEVHKTEHLGRQRLIYIGPRAQQILLEFLIPGSIDYCFRPCDSERQRRELLSARRTTPIAYGNRVGSNRSTTPRKSPGDKYTSDSYRRAIHRACDKAFMHPELSHLPQNELSTVQQQELAQWRSEHRWSPNRLRHSAATEIRKKFGLEAAQVVLGHSSAHTTQIYAERDMAKGFEVAKSIG